MYVYCTAYKLLYIPSCVTYVKGVTDHPYTVFMTRGWRAPQKDALKC